MGTRWLFGSTPDCGPAVPGVESGIFPAQDQLYQIVEWVAAYSRIAGGREVGL
jgi:hypothetical protein